MDPGGKEFNFGRVCDLHIPISYRMYVFNVARPVAPPRALPADPELTLSTFSARLEGKIPKRTFKELQEHPEWRYSGSQLP